MEPGDRVDRPHAHVTLGPLDDRGPIVRISHSLERFRTVAFGIEMMRDLIAFIPDEQACPFDCCGALKAVGGCRIDLARWFMVVPEVYREQVLAITQARFAAEWRHVMADRETLFAIVNDLNMAIGRSLVPVPPAEED